MVLLLFFFAQIIHRIIVTIVPCFVDISPKYKNHLPKFSDSSPLLASLSKSAQLNKFLELVDSPRPKWYSGATKQWLWVLRRGFFLSQKITKWRTWNFFFEKIYLIFILLFFWDKNWTGLKKILRGAIAAEVLNKMRTRACQSDR